ncbi:MAG: family 20 glycosylhydrolase [Clostridia bacterium]|nr:family 20 glycosylhydrolase [Clostridia bacterium]
MKKFNDTYAALKGDKKHISLKTELAFSNEIAAMQIDAIRESAECEGAVSDITVSAINNKILAKVKEQCGKAEEPAPDSYILEIEDGEINIYTDTENGLLYAACAIRSHYEDGIAEGILYNVPLSPFRGAKVYVPAEQNIPFFKEFIDMCMYYGYNVLIMEVGGAMEYKKHPEINEGWEEYCGIFQEYNRKSRDVQCSMLWNKNSIHWENGGGSFLSQECISQLLEYCRARGMKVIPEVPSLSHCDYLLTRHPELAENKEDPVPDTYCPSNPKTYELLFDVLDEIAEVFKPEMVHIAHDEWYSACVCDKCADKDAGVLYAEDINKIHGYLKKKGIDSMIWGDMLFVTEDVDGNIRGASLKTRRIQTDKKVNIRGKEYFVYDEYWCKEADETEGGYLFCKANTEKSMALIPRNLKIMNWYYNLQPKNDDVYIENGFQSVYGNFLPRSFKNWFARIEKGVGGFSISNWSMLDYRHMQRNAILFSIAYGSMMLWNRDFDEEKREENTLTAAHDLFTYHYRDMKNQHYAEIVHATDVKIPHEIFVDGSCMDEDADRMGYYRIEYEDGSSELYDVYWGLNIGILIPDWYDQSDDLSGEGSGVLEPTYTCDYEIVGKQAYYKLLIPLKKKAVRIIPEFFEKYRDNIYVKEIKVN